MPPRPRQGQRANAETELNVLNRLWASKSKVTPSEYVFSNLTDDQLKTPYVPTLKIQEGNDYYLAWSARNTNEIVRAGQIGHEYMRIDNEEQLRTPRPPHVNETALGKSASFILPFLLERRELREVEAMGPAQGDYLVRRAQRQLAECRLLLSRRKYNPFSYPLEANTTTHISIFIGKQMNPCYVVCRKLYRTAETNDFYYCPDARQFTEVIGIKLNSTNYVNGTFVTPVRLTHAEAGDNNLPSILDVIKPLSDLKNTYATFHVIWEGGDIVANDVNFVHYIRQKKTQVAFEADNIRNLITLLQHAIPNTRVDLFDPKPNSRFDVISERFKHRNVVICCGVNRGVEVNIDDVRALKDELNTIIRRMLPETITIHKFDYDVPGMERYATELVEVIANSQRTNGVKLSWIESAYTPLLASFNNHGHLVELYVELAEKNTSYAQSQLLFRALIKNHERKYSAFGYMHPRTYVEEEERENQASDPHYITNLLLADEHDIVDFHHFLKINKKSLNIIDLYHFNIMYLVCICAFMTGEHNLKHIRFTDNIRSSVLVLPNYRSLFRGTRLNSKVPAGDLVKNVTTFAQMMTIRLLQFSEKTAINKNNPYEGVITNEMVVEETARHWKRMYYASIIASTIRNSNLDSGMFNFRQFYQNDAAIEEETQLLKENVDNTQKSYILHFLNIVDKTFPPAENNMYFVIDGLVYQAPQFDEMPRLDEFNEHLHEAFQLRLDVDIPNEDYADDDLFHD